MKVMLPYREGEDCLYWEVGAFEYVMASEPYRYTWYLKQVMESLQCIKITFKKNKSLSLIKFS